MADVLKIVEILTGMGYPKGDIEDSLKQQKYDDIFATYLLLGRRSSDVRAKTNQTNKLCNTVHHY